MFVSVVPEEFGNKDALNWEVSTSDNTGTLALYCQQIIYCCIVMQSYEVILHITRTLCG